MIFQFVLLRFVFRLNSQIQLESLYMFTKIAIRFFTLCLLTKEIGLANVSQIPAVGNYRSLNKDQV